jgi:uncharacterized protein
MLSVDFAYELLKKEKVPEHIIRHSEKVALISLCLGSFLKHGNNPLLDLRVLTVSALLHDVQKMASLKSGENHAAAGYKLMASLGYPRVGEIIYAHIFLKLPKPGEPIKEEEIVFYADKRVKHDTIVSLKERFSDLRERYGRTLKAIIRMRLLEEMTILLEKRLFKGLPFSPSDLNKLNNVKEVRNVLKNCLESSPDCWWNFLRA